MRLLSLVLLACFALGPATAAIFWTSPEEWRAFKDVFNKSYSDKYEELFRRNLFESNLRQIRKHNLQADLGQHRYRLGINPNADLNYREYRTYRLGSRPPNDTQLHTTILEAVQAHLPASVDWRKRGYVTPVKNQGMCGSCWAFSSTGALEGQHFRKTGRLVSLSEQNLVDCTRNNKYQNAGCNGGWMSNAFLYARDFGIDTEASYPYVAKDGPCRFKKQNVGATDTGFVQVRPGDEQALKTAVAAIGPISVAIDAGQRGFQFYKSGIYEEPNCSRTVVNHGVLVVGYGSENGRDYWLIKNSWGKFWGLDGYMKMARNRNNMCAIASYAYYPLV